MKPIKFFRLSALLAVLMSSLTGTAPARVGTEECATCHRGIHQEWSVSLHAQAWTSPLFTTEHEKRSTAGETACDCHAPAGIAGLAPESVPPGRTESLHGGVDCLSCHVDSTQKIWSSGEKLYVPHFTGQDPSYATAAACSGCHQFARNSEFVCQECHMPDAAGPAADGKHLEQKTGAVHRSHRIVGSRDPEMVASGLSMKVGATGDDVRIELANLVDAHEVPANRRRSLMVALLTEADGMPLWSGQVTLEPGGQAEFNASAPAATHVELRFYPGPEVWPDSFYVIQRELLSR